MYGSLCTVDGQVVAQTQVPFEEEDTQSQQRDSIASQSPNTVLPHLAAKLEREIKVVTLRPSFQRTDE